MVTLEEKEEKERGKKKEDVKKRGGNEELTRHRGMDFGELIKPCLGSALQGVQFVPSSEVISFFGLAELLGLLHLGLVVILVL